MKWWFKLSLSSLVVVSAQQQSIFLNAGGPPSYRDSAGNEWIGDAYTTPLYYNSGSQAYSRPNEIIRGTHDPELYQTERWSSQQLEYNIPVDENGDYLVRLHFADIFPETQEPGARRFHVYIQDVLVLEDYDMVSLYDGYTAIVESWKTQVTDGSIHIRLDHGVENPKIAAIEVHPDNDGSSWKQVGQGIEVESDGGLFDQESLTMSGDGLVVAIGKTRPDESGSVDVHRYNVDYDVWQNVGDPIQFGGPFFGYSISFNYHGDVIAVVDPDREDSSSAYVFEYNGNDWERQQVVTGNEDELVGETVAISGNGSIVAVAMQLTGRIPGPVHFVRVFQKDGSDNWTPMGQDVYGQRSSPNDDINMDLSTDGFTIAIASPVPGFGYVEVHKYNSSKNKWEPVGESMEPQSNDSFDSVGIQVALSANGGIVAFGTSRYQLSNVVRVYKYDDGWKQLGDDIDTGGAENARRMSLDISGNGRQVAVGPQDSTSFSTVWGFDGIEWKQRGDDIPSSSIAPFGSQLQAIALSGSGSRVAVFDESGERVIVSDESLAE